MNIKLYIAIGIGGMIGSMGRYGISILFTADHEFPFATLTANLIGCFLLSFLLNHPSIKQKLSHEMFTAVSIGAIGSFTTFSTFAVETIELWSSNLLLAVGYILISILGGLVFCYVGFKAACRGQVEQ
ncbi:CrcB protein [Virgibacillus profundi]|uniref:Fluoride-specific ion channel FluC n=2 Tax=Virgibacillus profundi TaxID=2024555 RepID=A0A2A2IBY4_9BACI|nr:fluoride efflux transporter CrcB [Virgibacillus profundi]PAV28655.1 CrcB protein [Virgibacillus profundi]PXY52823.1 fluoride efflux transporter CrcB [Virgibacillus profundi]